VPQVEKALEGLACPVVSPPPKELSNLNELEWFLLSKMLSKLLEERESSSLH
jgi:hypothetical protein